MLDYMINANADESQIEGEEQMQRQMQYIFTQLKADAELQTNDLDDQDDDLEDQADNDEQSDDEVFDEDDDANEIKLEGVLVGEEWLTSQFLLANNEALSQTVAISKRIDDENKDKLNRSDISRNNRPISPFVKNSEGNPF